MLTRKSLLDISVTCIDVVLDQLLSLLEEMHRPYKTLEQHPSHVVTSEVFILSLAADCCTSHWEAVEKENALTSGPNASESNYRPTRPAPKPVENAFVTRMFEHFKFLRGPIADNANIPSRFIIEESSAAKAILDPFRMPSSYTLPSSSGSEDVHEPPLTVIPGLPTTSIEVHTNKIIQFVTASNWPATYDYLRSVVMRIRNSAPTQGGNVQTTAMVEDERLALVTLSLFGSMWIDAQKMGLVIQEFCSNFLHFRKPFQITISHIMPILMAAFIEYYPEEFAQLHFHRKRITGADTFFDMAQTIVEAGKRRALAYYPLQTILLLLQPDVFEVASNFRDAKSSAITKKVAFLETLKKMARNRNEVAIFCLVGSVRAARIIAPAGEEAGIVSWCWDIQDELREIVFPRYPAGSDGVLFDQDTITVAFISLTEFNFDTFHVWLSDECLRPSAPRAFKIALIQACSFFARQHNARRFQKLFVRAAPFVQEQLKVSIRP